MQASLDGLRRHTLTLAQFLEVRVRLTEGFGQTSNLRGLLLQLRLHHVRLSLHDIEMLLHVPHSLLQIHREVRTVLQEAEATIEEAATTLHGGLHLLQARVESRALRRATRLALRHGMRAPLQSLQP